MLQHPLQLSELSCTGPVPYWTGSRIQKDKVYLLSWLGYSSVDQLL